MAIAALEQLTAWQVPRIADALGLVTAAIAGRAAELGFEPLPADQRSAHLLGVRLPESVRSRVLPTMADLNCFAAVRGDSLRIAPHLHITDNDVSRLIQALANAKRDSR